MRLSIQGRPPEADARRAIHAALDEGITFIDTADVYCLDDKDLGHNERLIASVLSERSDRDSIRVGTKGGLLRPRGAWTNDGRPKHIREACEKSLRALGVEQIFLYQFHAPDPGIPFEKSVEAFAELQREGKCLHVGLSNVSAKQLQTAGTIIDVASVQNRFSLFWRDSLENGVVYECEQRRITFLAYSPLGSGRLARRLAKDPVLCRVAKRHDTSPHAVSLAWLRSKSETIVPIPGPTRVENVVASARAAALKLHPDDLAAIDGAEFSRT